MANINVRTDDGLKKQAEEILEDLGLSLTSAVNVFLRAVVRSNGLPFELKLEVQDGEPAADRRLLRGVNYFINLLKSDGLVLTEEEDRIFRRMLLGDESAMEAGTEILTGYRKMVRDRGESGRPEEQQ